MSEADGSDGCAVAEEQPQEKHKGKKPHILFPSIDQFRNVITRVKRHKGADGALLPTMAFQGTVKLHGTNASVCYNALRGLWFQSRNRIITPESDNCGFAEWATEREFTLLFMLKELIFNESAMLNPVGGTVTLFGEWCGKGIQKGVAISELDRMFVLFGACYTPFANAQGGAIENTETEERSDEVESVDEEEALDRKQWLDYSYLRAPESRIFNILDFPTFSVIVDFNQPRLVQNFLGEITAAVEEQCPVGAHFGVVGVGEGVVWTTPDSVHPYRFKVKGEKHSVTKVRTLANVDVEKIAGSVAFADYAVTTQRFSQALAEVVKGQVIEMRQLGDVIRWVVGDVHKEETDTLETNGLVAKDVNKYISDRVKKMFIEEMNK